MDQAPAAIEFAISRDKAATPWHYVSCMYIYRTLVQRCTQLCIYDITLHGSHVYRVPWAVTVYWCGLATAGVICYVMILPF